MNYFSDQSIQETIFYDFRISVNVTQASTSRRAPNSAPQIPSTSHRTQDSRFQRLPSNDIIRPARSKSSGRTGERRAEPDRLNTAQAVYRARGPGAGVGEGEYERHRGVSSRAEERKRHVQEQLENADKALALGADTSVQQQHNHHADSHRQPPTQLQPSSRRSGTSHYFQLYRLMHSNRPRVCRRACTLQPLSIQTLCELHRHIA